ncbi:Mesoderm induction early response protein 3 [Toxocara canis]|uniref:Mesoderm induction early response protein 3 n=1 Tax=Toxocara canis TaxID=6265 RepID=A0A0B2VEN4_TOXCA|nr:Mesoderm induction early response protein 3 [Toxocara canis]
MTDEEHSDSRTTDSYTEDDYEEAEEPYDDEGTLDEEEREHPEEDYHNELKMLEDDASLSVEELRRRYYGDGLEDEEHSTDDAQSSSAHSEDTLQDAETEDANSISQLNDTEMSAGSSSGGKSKAKGESRGYFSEEEDNEEDDEYVPPDPWRKNVRQGPFYQATIPAFISPDVDYSSAERELLLWRPPAESQMESVESYLRNFYDMAFRSSASANAADLSRLSVATQQQQPLRDDESALKRFLLFLALCSYTYRVAWCNLLPYRTVGELVQFYYIWKKTERHDMFEERIRATKRQEHSHCTDFMGSLIDHMDATTGDAPAHVTPSLDIATPAIPANLDLITEKEWSTCWQGANESTALPHLDNDTIANVLQQHRSLLRTACGSGCDLRSLVLSPSLLPSHLEVEGHSTNINTTYRSSRVSGAVLSRTVSHDLTTILRGKSSKLSGFPASKHLFKFGWETLGHICALPILLATRIPITIGKMTMSEDAGVEKLLPYCQSSVTAWRELLYARKATK